MRHRGSLALALVLLVSSCSSQTVETTITSGAQIAEPIDLNLLAEVLFIDEAEHFQIERAIQRCMEEAGFQYNISPYWPHDMFEDADWRVVANPPPAVGPDQTVEDEYRRTRFDISRAQVGWEDAFFGTEREFLDLGSAGALERPVGGCLDQSQATVVGDTRAWNELLGRVQGIEGEAYATAEATSAAQMAGDAWVSCMRARGFNVSSPGEVDPDRGEDPEAQDAYGECMNESGLAAIVGDERATVVDVLLQQNADILGPLLATIVEQSAS